VPDAIDRILEELLGKPTQPALKYDPMNFARPGPHITTLPPPEEAAFLQWVKEKKVPFDPQEKNSDYDMRGFWKALQANDPRAVQALDPNDKRMHFPDIWKTPYHETFSADSMYAMPGAPKWMGNRLVDQASGRVLFDDTAPKKGER
jgi:hypothetical protein